VAATIKPALAAVEARIAFLDAGAGCDLGEALRQPILIPCEPAPPVHQFAQQQGGDGVAAAECEIADTQEQRRQRAERHGSLPGLPGLASRLFPEMMPTTTFVVRLASGP
jgi:hypothetical protein